MEIMSLNDMWEKEERLKRETIGFAYSQESLKLYEEIEYLLNHHYDFYVSYDGDDEKTTTVYVDMSDYEYQFTFDEDGRLVRKSRRQYFY